MRKHQRYLPIRNADGQLLPHFVVIANGEIDINTVRAGNEAVLRARFEDAAFFHRADLNTAVDTMKQRLTRLTFTDQLGSMADRAGRIGTLAQTLANSLDLSAQDRATLGRAAELVKFDLGSQMVTEMTSLAGIMAREYLIAAGEPEAVADAAFESELPRQAGDRLPTSAVGALLAFADKLDSLIGLAATVSLPTGSSDPFALRRAALGAIAIHRNTPAVAEVSLQGALTQAASLQPVEVTQQSVEAVSEFLTRRLEQQLLDEGHAVDRVRAVLIHADHPQRADRTLTELSELIVREDFRRLAAALQRARRIVPAGTAADYDPQRLTEPAERRLHDALAKTRAALGAHANLRGLVIAATGLPEAVDEFFDEILVMADDADIRASRIRLVAGVAALGDDVLDWPSLRL